MSALVRGSSALSVVILLSKLIFYISSLVAISGLLFSPHKVCNYSGPFAARLLTAYGSSQVSCSECGLCRRRRHSPHSLQARASRCRVPIYRARHVRRGVLNSYRWKCNRESAAAGYSLCDTYNMLARVDSRIIPLSRAHMPEPGLFKGRPFARVGPLVGLL